MITMLTLDVHNPRTDTRCTLATIRTHDVRHVVNDMDVLLNTNGFSRLTVLSTLQHACADVVIRLTDAADQALVATELAEIGSFCQLVLMCLATGASFNIAVHYSADRP
jgi:hypothetical protein